MKIRPVTGIRAPSHALYGVGLLNGSDGTSEIDGAAAVAAKKPTLGGYGVLNYLGSTTDRFEFAEIPEIVFVTGFGSTTGHSDQVEEMGVFFADPNGRINPGDMWWWSNWNAESEPRTSRRLTMHDDHGGVFYTTNATVVYEGELPQGVSFNPITGVMGYDGSGAGGDSTVRFYANGKYSNWFRIRVLTPTFIWGHNATSRTFAPSLSAVPKYNAYTGTGTAFSQVADLYTASEPMVALVLDGLYDTEQDYALTGKYIWQMGDESISQRRSMYLLGEPGKFPTFYRAESASTVATVEMKWPTGYEEAKYNEHVQYLKGFNFRGRTNVNYDTARWTARLYHVTQCYFHREGAAAATSNDGFDSTGGDGFTAEFPPMDAVNVAWTLSTGFPDLVGYRVYGSKDGGSYSLIKTVLVGDLETGSSNRYGYTHIAGVAPGTWNYYVEAYNSTGGTARRYSQKVTKAITNISNADPAVVTIPNHGFAEGSLVRLVNISGMIDAQSNPVLEGDYFTVADVTADTFALRIYGKTAYRDTSALTPFSSGNAENFDISAVDQTGYKISDLVAKLIVPYTNDGTFVQNRGDKIESPSEDWPTTGENSTRGGYGAPYRWETRHVDHFWNVQFSRWIGSGGTKHPVYCHGSPWGFVLTNNCWWRGGYASSAIKSTRTYNHILNSKFWQWEVEDLAQTVQGSLQRFTDCPSFCHSITYNCDFKTLDRTSEWCWQNPRGTTWAQNIWPPYPDICTQQSPFTTFSIRVKASGIGDGTVKKARIKGQHETAWRDTTGGTPYYWAGGGSSTNWDIPIHPDDIPQSGVYAVRINVDGLEPTAIIPGVLPNSEEGGEVTLVVHRTDGWLYVSSSYPIPGPLPLMPAVGSYPLEKFDQDGSYFTRARGVADAGLDDPLNPYASKHYFAFCRFMAPSGSLIKGNPVKDQTPHPKAECGTLGAEYRGGVPSNYHPLTQTFFANNTFTGWTLADEIWNANTARWMSTDPAVLRGEYYHNEWYWPTETAQNARFFGVDENGDVQFEDLGVSNVIPSAPSAPRVTLPEWFNISTQAFRDIHEATLPATARQLNPREFVQLDCPNLATAKDDRGRYIGDISETQDTGEVYLTAWNWANTVEWDQVKRQITWVGSNHYTDGYVTDSKWFRYDVTGNSWSAISSPHGLSNPTSGNGMNPPLDTRIGVLGWKTGHAYNENALDTKRRILWKHDGGTDAIRGLNIDDETYWGRIYLPSTDYGFGRVLIYNPDLDALIYVIPYDRKTTPVTKGQIWVRRSLAGTAYYDRGWEQVANDCEFLTWHMVGHYHPRAKKTIVGGGMGGGIESLAFYEIDNNLNVTRLPDSPYIISVSEPGSVLPEPPPTNDPKRAQFCADPNSNKSVIFHGGTGDGIGKVYEYDHDTRTWGTDVVATLPYTNKNCLVCSIPDYNVITVMQWGGNGTSRMYLYRNS